MTNVISSKNEQVSEREFRAMERELTEKHDFLIILARKIVSQATKSSPARPDIVEMSKQKLSNET